MTTKAVRTRYGIVGPNTGTNADSGRLGEVYSKGQLSGLNGI